MANLLSVLALLLCGYSIFSAFVLGVTQFRTHANYPIKTRLAVWLLLVALAGLQLCHFLFLVENVPWLHSPVYNLLLFAVAPAFYFFSRPLLHATAQQPYPWLHTLPVITSLFLPSRWALPLAFAVGAGYLLWLAHSVYALRAQRNQFRWELIVLGSVFVIALSVMLLGLAVPLLPETLFFSIYASAIGVAFILVNLVLSRTPQLSTQVEEAARATYAVSTLTNIDPQAVLERLTHILTTQKAFQAPDFSLDALAQQLHLSAHQTSELINVHLGKGFSRLVREYRIDAAKTLLIAEPNASVLSVGLSVGFTSQSNFYEAFREIVGTTPAHYRKITLAQKA